MRGQLRRETIDRLSIITMAGIAAEALQFGNAEGGRSDEAALVRSWDGRRQWRERRHHSHLSAHLSVCVLSLAAAVVPWSGHLPALVATARHSAGPVGRHAGRAAAQGGRSGR